ncbi:MAG: phosphatidate cytidylyltransferase [Chloroflexi bacterium]|nr:phosphatidate cytidylyltransferase [Chloroflexota bacterium]
MNNTIALIITFTAALGWLRLMDYFAHRGWIESRLSRKIIHISTGPIFVLCWLLFDDAPSARWLASLVPLAITIQFALIGMGILKDDASIKAMSRSGDRREILRGPLFYGIVFVLVTLLYWRDTPIGIVALMVMCGGDGIADVVGRKINSPKLFWSSEKSVAGSLGVLIGGWLLSALVVAIYVSVGLFEGPFSAFLLPLSAISFAGMLIESLPFRDVDNLTVAFTAVLVGHWFF